MIQAERGRSQKSGAKYAFKTSNYLQTETVSNSSEPATKVNIVAVSHQASGAMVTERVPPKAPSHPIQMPKAEAIVPVERPADDDDDDIVAVFDKLSLVKSKYRNPQTSLNHPPHGHPAKITSSTKKRANLFIQQKTRPEHHLGTQVYGPRPPTYEDRKPPPMPIFSSMPSSRTTSSIPDGEIFYTDPSKASADLKALLEGGFEEEEVEKEETDQLSKQIVDVDQSATKEPEKPTESHNSEQKESFQVNKDWVVAGLKVRLLPHQVEGVNWMRGRELGPVKRGKVPKGGLLADDMGLGKTLQSVSVILLNQKPPRDSKSWKKHFEGVEKTTLVVAPLALIRQWEHEITDKVARSHGLKVLVHHGPQRTKDFKKLALYDVVITTYQILVTEHGHSSAAEGGLKTGCFGLHWWRIILDEAHTIKNRNTKATKACYALCAEYRWCLSGTPMQNNLDELQSLVRFLRIAPYDDLKQWKEHIDRPMKNGKGHIAIHRLHSLLRCFMKRRTKDILKAAGALNPGGKPLADGDPSATGFRHTQRNVVTLETKLTPAEQKFYDRLEARADRSLEAMMKDKMSYANAFTLLLRLRQACNHPQLVAGKLEKDKDALSTGTSQKSQDVDIDGMTDMLSGMGIATKSCAVCGKRLNEDEVKLEDVNCSECQEDLNSFRSHERKRHRRKRSKGEKALSTSAQTQGDSETDAAVKPAARRARSRRAIIDSDSEESEEEDSDGRWLVPEGERGSLRLGKAGGEEDENADGGGEWIGKEYSFEDAADEHGESNLSSFIVDDETAKNDPRYRWADEHSDDEDSLPSIATITKQMASQSLRDNRGAESISSYESDSASGQSSEDESDVNDSDLYRSAHGGRRSAHKPGIAISSKIRELTRLLRAEAHEHKFIVFSQFTSMLNLVEPFLQKERFRFVRYDGSMKNDEREESLRKLRQDPAVRILLCSLKCGSLGLNLTAATRVVIVEPFWNPFVEEQAIDRVHRLTQTVDVTVYKLTVPNTVEARILALQDKKRQLAAEAIESGAKKSALKLGLNEIIDLFKPGARDHEENPYDDTSPPRAQLRTSSSARKESEVFGRRW